MGERCPIGLPLPGYTLPGVSMSSLWATGSVWAQSTASFSLSAAEGVESAFLPLWVLQEPLATSYSDGSWFLQTTFHSGLGTVF